MMSNPETCEIRDCEQPAIFGVIYTSPAERVDYCDDHAREKKRELDYASVIRL